MDAATVARGLPAQNMRATAPVEFDLATGERRLRVALVGSCYWPLGGGMEVYLRQLAGALAQAGHDVRVITRFTERQPKDMEELHLQSEAGRTYTDGNVQVQVISPSGPGRLMQRPAYRLHFRLPALAARLIHLAHRRSMRAAFADADVVHYSGTGRELLGFAARWEARRRGVPFVVTPHTHAGLWGDGPLDLDLYRRADAVVALTEDELRRLRDAGVSPFALEVVAHGVSTSGGGDGTAFRKRHGIGDHPVVLYLGRKTPDKGFDVLLEATQHLWERVPEARLVLAGTEGPDRPLPPAAADPRVVELGRIDDAEREDAYEACDVLCLPSQAEAFGLVILEAWAYGKPVVVSDIPTLRERVAHGGGIAARPEPRSIADALGRVLNDPDLRRQLSAEARMQAARATWAYAAAAMTGIYHRAVAGVRS